MSKDTGNKHIDQDTETQYSESLIREVFKNETGYSIAPYSVHIGCQQLAKWCHSHNQTLSIADLEKEINAWHSLLCYRKVNRLLLSQPLTLWGLKELDNVMTRLTESLRCDDKAQFAVSVSYEECDTQTLNTLCKLGFNHIYINVPQDITADLFSITANRAEKAGFTFISIIYPVKQPFTRSSSKIIELLSRAQPTALKLTSTCDSAAALTEEIRKSGICSSLFRFNYKQWDGRTFVKTSGSVYVPSRDELSLGPQAISHFGKIDFLNLSRPSTYQHAISAGHLPIGYFKASKTL